jgi:hypothetical protein
MNNPNSYCAVSWYRHGQETPSLFTVDNKVIIFDTLAIAQNFLPILGDGRTPVWNAAGDVLCFLEIDPKGMNKLEIITDYDVYDLPAGMPPGIRSETKTQEWKYHIHWGLVFNDVGQVKRNKEGKVINNALSTEFQELLDAEKQSQSAQAESSWLGEDTQ